MLGAREDATMVTEYVAVNKGPLVLGITMAMCVAGIVTVIVRVYSRKFVKRFWGLDDWLIVAACPFTIGDEVLRAQWCFHGLGTHSKSVSEHDLETGHKIAYAIQIMYPFSLGLVKISILTFYLRLFPHQTFRKICFVGIGIIGTASLAVSAAQAFVCRPIRLAWLSSLGNHCGEREILQYFASILNLVTDLAVLLLPMKYLWAMTLERRKRFQTIFMFSLGFLTCVDSAFRLSTIHMFYRGADPTYDAYLISICSGIEINLAIITASLPATKPVVLNIWHPLRRLYGSHDVFAKQRETSTSAGSTTVGSDLASRTYQRRDSFGGNYFDCEWGSNYGPRGGRVGSFRDKYTPYYSQTWDGEVKNARAQYSQLHRLNFGEGSWV